MSYKAKMSKKSKPIVRKVSIGTDSWGYRYYARWIAMQSTCRG